MGEPASAGWGSIHLCMCIIAEIRTLDPTRIPTDAPSLLVLLMLHPPPKALLLLRPSRVQTLLSGRLIGDGQEAGSLG